MKVSSRGKMSVVSAEMTLDVVSGIYFLYGYVRESVKYHLADFFPLRGYPPPYPRSGISFCSKELSGIGGYPPPPLTENRRNFLKEWVKKG